MTLKPSAIRYIKLGRGDAWADVSLREDQIHFSHRNVPHELCLSGDWEAVRQFLISQGRTPNKASDFTREIRDFYTLGPDCLWFTFSKGYLWWAFAEPDVVWLGETPEGGARMRKTIDGWHNADADGRPLRMDTLSSRLTATAAYRQTICSIKCEDYLLRRLGGSEEPVVAKARSAQAAMVEATLEMIPSLHWADFEDLVDLIFARSGWNRVSRVGGTQKDIDLEVVEPATGARGFVQIKSRAGQRELDDYIDRFNSTGGYTHMFFICHSPHGDLDVGEAENVHVWTRKSLAHMVIKAGLYEWLIERSL